MLTEKDKHVLTLLATLDAETRPEQRRRLLQQLRTHFAGKGERQRMLRRCLRLLARNEKLRNEAQGEIAFI
jgi:hypothetical protein